MSESEAVAEPTVAQVEALSGAEEAKKLGNDAFADKRYDEAIKHYSEAIRQDPTNPVYYSNRSACHASKKDWKASLEDAAQCVVNGPNFVKGYYRLATAQTELMQYDDAINTLNAAMAKEPENDMLTKQLKLVRSKKAAAAAKAKRPQKALDESQRKELNECREQGGKLMRDLRQVSARLGSCQRDMRANQVTSQQIKELTEGVTTYRTVGKAFFLTPRDEIDSRLTKELETLSKNQTDLADRKVYLERRVESNTQHMKDIMGQA